MLTSKKDYEYEFKIYVKEKHREYELVHRYKTEESRNKAFKKSFKRYGKRVMEYGYYWIRV